MHPRRPQPPRLVHGILLVAHEPNVADLMPAWDSVLINRNGWCCALDAVAAELLKTGCREIRSRSPTDERGAQVNVRAQHRALSVSLVVAVARATSEVDKGPKHAMRAALEALLNDTFRTRLAGHVEERANAHELGLGVSDAGSVPRGLLCGWRGGRQEWRRLGHMILRHDACLVVARPVGTLVESDEHARRRLEVCASHHLAMHMLTYKHLSIALQIIACPDGVT
eukprot:3567084-Prymnesium_polylepis.1